MKEKRDIAPRATPYCTSVLHACSCVDPVSSSSSSSYPSRSPDVRAWTLPSSLFEPLSLRPPPIAPHPRTDRQGEAEYTPLSLLSSATPARTKPGKQQKERERRCRGSTHESLRGNGSPLALNVGPRNAERKARRKAPGRKEETTRTLSPPSSSAQIRRVVSLTVFGSSSHAPPRHVHPRAPLSLQVRDSDSDSVFFLSSGR
ncbi:hypothetical protein K438DRAFT_1967195 [Mycena galopus ATCC 62051]|nr:hypothetical protein K438DRAFT_1967195 [Mycena galopus ATCC 62051]